MGTEGEITIRGAVWLVETLAPLGAVSSRRMFGGYGVFEGSAMFALITGQGEIFFKTDDSNRPNYEAAGAHKHDRMPYYSVPAGVLGDPAELHAWAGESIRIARAAKK